MAKTLGQIEADLVFLQEQVTDLNNTILDLVPKIQMKQLSILLEAELAAIRAEINTINTEIANLKSLH